MQNEKAIGVFDSGVGGLTVLYALQNALPLEKFIYLGDTARVPYGTRSPETIIRYSKRVAGHLYKRDIKALVIACNTATSYALESLQNAFEPIGIPVFGVIKASAFAALDHSTNNNILVLGTEGTIRGEKYSKTIQTIEPTAKVHGLACPLFVPLIEEGWHKHPVTETVAREYFGTVQNLTSFDTAILGCTHYPLLKPMLSRLFPTIHFIDSAATTASMVKAALASKMLTAPDRESQSRGETEFLVTDNLQRFHKVGYYFVGSSPSPIQMVDLSDSDEQIVAGLL